VIRSIEGLRGVAALMVVFFHAFVLTRWGGAPAQWGLVQNAWLFVDLFFVISGAIMAMVYGQRLQDEILHGQPAATHALDDVLHRQRCQC